MMPRGPLSPAGAAVFSGYGGTELQQQMTEQTEELRRKRQIEAQAANYSPAGVALSAMGTLT